jgi:hypothetical protein
VPLILARGHCILSLLPGPGRLNVYRMKGNHSMWLGPDVIPLSFLSTQLPLGGSVCPDLDVDLGLKARITCSV